MAPGATLSGMTGGCILKTFGNSVEAAVHATSENPVNAPARGAQRALSLAPQHIALLTSRYWGPSARRLRVSFMEKIDYSTRLMIMQHCNAWYGVGAGIRFVYTTGEADVRITREQEGYWSYLGTDVRLVPPSEPTMCLQSFSSATPLSEYRRVVRHEAGHTLGFTHEHLRSDLVRRIDPQLAYRYFARTQGWSPREVDRQVLTPESEADLLATRLADETSVMCYQLPGSITKDGLPIHGGTDINARDADFARRVYPRR